jgi:hypothetical protein
MKPVNFTRNQTRINMRNQTRNRMKPLRFRRNQTTINMRNQTRNKDETFEIWKKPNQNQE